MGLKDFKTIDELLEKLEERGVTTDAQSRLIILSESYYAVVNGYKDLFLDKVKMTATHEDVYKEGTRFSEIYSLFAFDRELRALTFGHLIKAEALLKTTTVYAFCEVHQGHEDYLDKECYVNPRDMLMPRGSHGDRYKKRSDNLSKLLEILEGKARGETSYKAFIQHYIDHYGFVPLWVLSNDLTFGNMSHFYQLQTRNIQNKVCKQIAEYRRAYGDAVKNLPPIDLLHAYNVLCEFRNYCAHDDRLYSARAGKGKDIAFKEMVRVMGTVLPDKDCKKLKSDVVKLVHKYSNHFVTISIDDIYKAMGGISETEWA